jgi:hypothetical protein
MAKKDKKSKTAEQKARVAAKQTKKAAKGEKKAKTKSGDESDAEDIDLDAVLAEYAEQQARFLKVTETPCEPPSSRAYSTLIASPSNRNELFLFGGEFYDGELASFFNNLYVYLIDRSEWREITSPNSPLPRSGHAWCRGGNSGGIYLFGGEFSSPKQGTFYHYNDFWHLDTSTREWTRLETKSKGPPARSGHRMTYYKNYIILYGGFQDTSQQTKYLQDLWIYDCQNFTWYNPTLPPATQKPDARSSFSLLPHESGAVIYGGYSRVKATTNVSKQKKGGPQAQRSILKPLIHQDTWFLRITPPSTEETSSKSASSPSSIRWERRKRPANSPNPPRAGATMAHHKGRGILFGGVKDVEESEEGIESEFFDGLFAYNVDRNRFFPLTLRRPKAAGKKQPASQTKAKDRGKADEEELLRNLAALEATGSIAQSNVDDGAMDVDTKAPDPDTEKAACAPLRMELPHPRFNAQLAVQDDTLFIFGGTFERKDQEFLFNDLLSIDLGKLDGVRELFSREPANWNDAQEEEDSDDDEGDYEDMSGSDDDGDEDAMSIDVSSTAPTEITPQITKDEDLETEPEQPPEQDSKPYPRPFESLRDFFTRTTAAWQDVLIESLKEKSIGGAAGRSVKELRKEAFELAEEKWWDCREEVRALEDVQEEAGIGEVVSLGDRGGEGAGRARR